ncbi:hypothetical protein Y032_0040g253 [Ancylostoma ceylanicum]|uniref:Uncharacterized protein n=1 Tax=Ancylostoma ceylanicum TaxID=53326 RepID=A0A016UGR1_9BILA|nr:hypothetical protein Y032_0040g253 [Ancylostoma ceylanicum]
MRCTPIRRRVIARQKSAVLTTLTRFFHGKAALPTFPEPSWQLLHFFQLLRTRSTQKLFPMSSNSSDLHIFVRHIRESKILEMKNFI